VAHSAIDRFAALLRPENSPENLAFAGKRLRCGMFGTPRQRGTIAAARFDAMETKTMRNILLACIAIAAFPVAVLAADANANYYGNTITLSDSKSGTRTLFINADNTYTIHVADGTTVNGTWEAKGDQTCFTQLSPAPQPGASNPYCTPSDVHQVGDTWQMAGPSGSTVTISLKAGR
jgi:hypothetical protein